MDGSDQPCLIGIDCGTQSIRAIAFDSAGRKLAASARPTPIKRCDSGGEHDPDAIFTAVLVVLGEVAVALAGRPVAGIAVASFGESCVLVDRAGKAAGPAIAWFDSRTKRFPKSTNGLLKPSTSAIVSQRAGIGMEDMGQRSNSPRARSLAGIFAREVGRDRIFAITGQSIEWTMTLYKLAWMRAHWPDAIRRAQRVLMMADWIAFRLCGEAATDSTLASRTQYFAIHERQWSPELFKRAFGSTDVLPPLMASGTALAPVDRDWLSETRLAGAPIVGVGGHDHVVGSLAVGVKAPGTLFDSIGTAEGLLLVTDRPIADPEVSRHGYVQGAIATHRNLSFAYAGINSCGGALEWCRRLIGSPAQEAIIAAASRVPPGSRGVVFWPDLVDGPPPDPDPDSRGAFVGLSTAVDQGTLYRAVLEGVVMRARLVVDGMVRLPGVLPPRAIRVIGGGSRNAPFLKIRANVFGRPLTVVDEPEATALGAALLGGVAAGVYRDLDEALTRLDRREHVVEPDGEAAFYDALRTRVFEQLQPALTGVHRALAGTRPDANI